MKFPRITVNQLQMEGLPCIRGLAIPVATIMAALAERMTEAEVLAAYPELELEDIHEAILYTAFSR